MKKFTVLLLVMLGLTGCVDQKADPASNPKQFQSAQLVEVVDGDTAMFKINGKVETVRFLLVDTPETHYPKKGKQPFGPEASEFTKNLLTHAKRITLEFDVEKRDEYGRMLAYVYADGKSVQEELLKRGLARVSYIYESRRHLTKYRKTEDVARKKQNGIWQCPEYVTNHGFDSKKWCKGSYPFKFPSKNAKPMEEPIYDIDGHRIN